MGNNFSAFSTGMILYATDVLSQLQASLFIAKTASRKYAPPSHRGGIVDVPTMSDPVAQYHTVDGGAVTPSDINVTAVPVVLDQYAHATYHVDSIDMILTNIAFRQEAAQRGAYVLAAAVEGQLAALADSIPAFYGDPTTSAFDDAALSKVANCIRILDEANAPEYAQRFCAVSSRAKQAALTNDGFTKYVQAGEASQNPLLKGTMGERLGVTFGLSQTVKARTRGGATAWGTPVVATGAGAAIGAPTLLISGAASSGALKKGDSFYLDGFYYAVTANVTASSGNATIAITPALKTAPADGTSLWTGSDNISNTDGAGVVTAVPNMLYIPEAFAVAIAPIADDNRPGTETDIVSDSQTGLSIRVTHSWQHIGTSTVGGFQHIFSTELLFGVKLVRPEYAVRLISSN